jgi:hypothetical protein
MVSVSIVEKQKHSLFLLFLFPAEEEVVGKGNRILSKAVANVSGIRVYWAGLNFFIKEE